MENAYGIGVKNRYELFYDEDVDPLEIIRQQEEEKVKRKTDKTLTKDKTKPSKSGKQITAVPKKPAKETPVAISPKPTENLEKPRTRPYDRAAKISRGFDESKDVEERKNFRNREDNQPVGSDTRDRDPEARRGRGGFRGRGRGGRGRGGFFNNFEGRPRREFDRHSGSEKTGHRSVEKRDGAGSNNWGDIKSDLKKEPESTWVDEEFDASGQKNSDLIWRDVQEENEIQCPITDESQHDKITDDVPNENMDSKENEPVPEERTEESVKEMTLDEWKREQEAKRAVPKYNLRKPGEGEDGNQWKKLYMLKKKAKEEDDDEEDEEDEDVDDEEFARRGRQRQLVDIQINFNDSRRGRGRGRGGVRGIGPRSGGVPGNKEIPRPERRDDVPGPGPNIVGRSFTRGGPKSSKSGQQSAPRVDDWNDFPSLVTV